MKTIYKFIMFAMLFGVCNMAFGQHIMGVVYGLDDGKKTPLPGAAVFWQGTTTGTTTDENGKFHISRHDSTNKFLIVSYLGYLKDTVIINNQTHVEITLVQSLELKEVQIVEERSNTSISTVDPLNIQQINKGDR